MSLNIVVGAARGIGRAIAEELARADPDAALLVADVDADGAEQLAQVLRGQGSEVNATKVDVGDVSSVEALVAQSSSAGKVAIAAGIFRASPTVSTSVSEFEEVYRINAIGCFHVAQQYAAAMAAANGGAIVAVGSIAARMPRMRQAAYSSSKAALRQALRVLAMEVSGSGVRINMVSPGPTDTEMMRQLASDHRSVDDLAEGSLEALRPRIPAGHVATASDIAAVVAFLLSPASRHVVMGDIVVDGGELLGM
jgi:2,3-dihydro-2,3-dihydroxybenzoate dehydrogenase